MAFMVEAKEIAVTLICTRHGRVRSSQSEHSMLRLPYSPSTDSTYYRIAYSYNNGLHWV